MDKLKKYNVVPSNSDVFAISLVDEPAVDSNFIALSKQKPMEFKIQNEERRMLYGVALRADYPIYRRYGDEEFYLTFGKDAIRRLMTKFMKNFGQRSWTKDHMDFAEGITVVESWIVEDVENDKANALGIENFSEGSWCIGAKVDDDEIWQSIKEGRWKGFSVEAWVDMEEIEKEIKNKKINKENKEIDMAVKKSKFEEMIDKIKSIISDAVTEADGKDMEVQEEVIDEAADAVEEVVNKDKTDTTNEVVEAAEEDKTPTEEIVNDVVDTVQEETQTTEEAADNLQEVVDQLQAEVDSLKAENEELKKKNQKMSKQPSTKVVTNKTENKVGGIKGAFAALKAQGIIS